MVIVLGILIAFIGLGAIHLNIESNKPSAWLGALGWFVLWFGVGIVAGQIF